jgi:hypothetical protein
MSWARTELLKDRLLPKLLLWLLWVLSTSDCTFTPEPNTAPHEAATVLFRGCRVLQQTDAGTVCLPSAISQTIVWIADRPCDTVELAEDGTSVATSSKWVEGGCQIRPSERSTKQTSTYSIRERKSGNELWRLNYDRSKPWLLELTDRMWLRADPDLKGVVGTEPTVVVGIDEHPAVTVDRAYAAAVVLIRQGKIDESLRALAEVQELAMRLGYPSVALDTAFRRMTMLRFAGLPDEAELVRQDIANQVPQGFGWARILILYNAGRNLLAAQKLIDAEVQLHNAVVDAKRINDISLNTYKLTWLEALLGLGRTKIAQLEINAISKDDIDSCQNAELFRQLAELQIPSLALSSMGVSSQLPGNPESLLLQSLAARLQCPDATSLATLYTDLAQVAFFSNRINDAQDMIAKARAQSALTNLDQMELLELEARIAINSKQYKKAILLYDKLEDLSSKYPADNRYALRCRIAVGLIEASRDVDMSQSASADEARKCVQPQSSLSFQERDILLQRLHLIGVK